MRQRQWLELEKIMIVLYSISVENANVVVDGLSRRGEQQLDVMITREESLL